MLKILVDVETDRKFGREIMLGVAKYSRHFGPWSFFTDMPFYVKSEIYKDEYRVNNLKDIDGIIMRESPALDRIISEGIPVIVCPYSVQRREEVTNIIGDVVDCSVMAADHLIEKGIRNFAFCGFKSLPVSDERRYFFTKKVEEYGYSVDYYNDFFRENADFFEDEKAIMAGWLKMLPKPVGIMCCNDDRSQHIVEACKAADISIPDEAAVIGVDNDELVCEFSSPRLSSVGMNFRKAGYEAAAMLSDMIKGEKKEYPDILALSTSITERESTSILAVDDKAVAEAVRFIRDNAGRIIDVDDVVDAVYLSRRVLEKRFKSSYGKTVYNEIKSTRAKRIADILLETDNPISKIALDIGYSSEEHIARFFKSVMNVNPHEYRKLHKII